MTGFFVGIGVDGPPAAREGLLVPADTGKPIRFVDLGANVGEGVRRAIGANLVEKLTIDGPHGLSTDVVVDEEGGPGYREDAVLNERATELIHLLKAAQAWGGYPAPEWARAEALIDEAALWRLWVRLYGDVVFLGADEKTGDWVSAPACLREFLTEVCGVEPVHGMEGEQYVV